MGTAVSGTVKRLDGAPEATAYLTATLMLPSGETTAILAGGRRECACAWRSQGGRCERQP